MSIAMEKVRTTNTKTMMAYKLANYASGKDEIKHDISNLTNQRPTFILAIWPTNIRVSHITPFFELSYTLLTTHAHGLYEVTKKISAL